MLRICPNRVFMTIVSDILLVRDGSVLSIYLIEIGMLFYM